MAQEKDYADSALAPYRALDLTEGGYNWCGKALADLGADVIKVEPPQGSATRNRAPFYKDEPHAERSLFWYAYCLNKRGLTLDLERPEGQELFRQLVSASDFVLESFVPGYMDSLGLGYDSLSRANPGLIMTSMTPFGQEGPHAQYKAPDLVAWSMGGMQYVSGDEDRPPVRISFPQAELHAGAQGVAGSMVALWHREETGEGQQVDVSMQEAVMWTLMNATTFPKLHKTNVERAGPNRRSGSLVVRNVFPCKDGYVAVTLSGGMRSDGVRALVRWMDEDGLAPDYLKNMDWYNWDLRALGSLGEEGERQYRAVEDPIAEYFLTKTKAELFRLAVPDRLHLAPCNTVRDISEDPQLRAREFWVEVDHPELNSALTYPGPYIKLSESPIQARRRAPLIGEHNEEIYVGELGLNKGRLAELKGLGVI